MSEHRWSGVEGSPCHAAHTATKGVRAWCSACSEWCYERADGHCMRCDAFRAPAHRWTPSQEALIAGWFRDDASSCGWTRKERCDRGHEHSVEFCGEHVTHVSLHHDINDNGGIYCWTTGYCAEHAPPDAIPLGPTEETT